MKKLVRIVRNTVLTGLLTVLLVFAWLTVTKVTAAGLPPLRSGDLVFQTSGGGQSLAILAASHSAYTHTGIIELDNSGSAMVLEAVGPVKLTPLDDWIRHGTGGRITIKRVKGLTEEEAKQALAAAHVYDGKPYDIFFLPGKDEIYCSELVHLAFSEGPAISLGKTQKVGDLAINNPATRKLVRSRWQRYPLCSAGKVDGFENCFAIMLQQELVTPASIAQDHQLETIYTNFGILAE